MEPKEPRARIGPAVRSVLGWPARRLLDKRIEWMLGSFNYRQDRVETELRHATEALGEALLDRRLARLSAAEGLSLPADTARFLNWAEGAEGPAARAGLWFNPPVPVRYGEDEAEVLLVNERIVEQPYVFGALRSLPSSARILDVGGSESTVGLSLASLGYQVDVVDPRPHPLEHPRLRHHPTTLAQLPPELRFDAAIALSSIEHFGLGAYGQPEAEDQRLDRAALSDMRERLLEGGVLALTVPCGPVSTRDEFQRTYSLEELTEMLAGWEIVDLSAAWQTDIRTWVTGDPRQPQGQTGVALITARKPA